MAVKDKFINSKPTDVKENAMNAIKDAASDKADSLKDAASDKVDSAKDAFDGLEEKAKEKAKEEANKGLEALQALVEEKVSEIIQKLGASPEDAEKVIALAKEHVPDEAKSAVSDTVKKIL